MNVATNYPTSFCDTCIAELESAANIREHFKKTEQYWMEFINRQNKSIAIKQEPECIIFDELENIPTDNDPKLGTSSMPKINIKIENEPNNTEFRLEANCSTVSETKNAKRKKRKSNQSSYMNFIYLFC